MKKKLSAILVIVLVLSTVLCIGVSADDYESKLYYVSRLPAGATITVDGDVDPIWESVEPQPITRYDDMGYEYTETTGTLRIVWNDKGFYALVEVDKKGEPVYTDCVNPGFGTSYESIDCVQLSYSPYVEFMSWGHAGSQDYAYTGGACPDFDGNKNLCGWWYAYGSEHCQAVAKQTADDKYVAEFFFPWMSPTRQDVYGAGGLHGGNYGDPGSCSMMMLDVSIHVQSDDGTGEVAGTEAGHTSIVSYNMYPFKAYSLPNYAYILLTNDVIAPAVSVGDCNGDGNIDTKDATLLLQYLAEWDVEDNINFTAADCNGDETIDTKDATLLLQYLAEWDVTLG